MLVRDNKYIPAEDKDFFILLRIGLWQKVEEPLSDSPDWDYIYKLACEQTVQGIVYDGLCLYLAEYPEVVTDQQQNNRFFRSVTQVITRNYDVNKLQAKLCCIFDEHCIPYVVLKGQPLAQLYAKPLMRCSGDIDFLLRKEDFEKAVRQLEPCTTSVMSGNRPNGRYGFYCDDIPVELHTNLLHNIDELRCNLEKKEKEIFELNDYEVIVIGGYPTKLPTIDYHLPFLFYHILKHLFGDGIGLRQLCDFAVCLKHSIDDGLYYNQISFSDSVLTHLWNQMCSFSVFFLGLRKGPDSPIRLTGVSEVNGIWHECKRTGNFGAILPHDRSDSFWQRNFLLGKKLVLTYHKNRRINRRYSRILFYRDVVSLTRIARQKLTNKKTVLQNGI